MSLTKRTPCVGICSTTYGDLVCRGCKRFAHEIVQWNGYDDLQQAVRERLQRVRDEVLSLLLVCHDEALLQNALSDAGLQDLDLMEAQYQLLRFMVRREQPLASVGLALAAEAQALATPLPAQADKVLDTLYLMQLLDSETFQRAKAHYDRNFKVPA